MVNKTQKCGNFLRRKDGEISLQKNSKLTHVFHFLNWIVFTQLYAFKIYSSLVINICDEI